MSFYIVIKTEISNKQYIISTLKEMQRRGEITRFLVDKKKEQIEIDRDGDIIIISKQKSGNFEVTGDARIVRSFSKRLTQLYAYSSIKENLPLDFEIAHESEVAGE
ncbi:MAG: hypothetical protein V3S49_00020, partial [Thermodesulfobacteriota bacterium]